MNQPVIRFHRVSKHYVKQRLRYGMLSEAIDQLLPASRQSLIAADGPPQRVISTYRSLTK